jgi:hypothetical protein
MLSKYYSLDECYNRDVVLNHLEDLEDEGLIVYEMVEPDVMKLKDVGLSEKQTKELINFFSNHDVIDYPDFEPYDEDDFGDDEDEDYYGGDDLYRGDLF